MSVFRQKRKNHTNNEHFTVLSSPAENRYGCRGLTTNPLTALIWPVKVSFKPPSAPAQHLAKSQTYKTR